MRTQKLVRCLGFPILTCCAAMISACAQTTTPDVEATVHARLTQEAAQQTEVARSVQQTLDAQPTDTPIPSRYPTRD